MRRPRLEVGAEAVTCTAREPLDRSVGRGDGGFLVVRTERNRWRGRFCGGEERRALGAEGPVRVRVGKGAEEARTRRDEQQRRPAAAMATRPSLAAETPRERERGRCGRMFDDEVVLLIDYLIANGSERALDDILECSFRISVSISAYSEVWFAACELGCEAWL
ncbi:uncharacterized protein A4U43_C02F2620 [Asparagus officinalis]|uniref:Uncharacterized protein n=1 Tax=Asparagus officinalis TaxID=4686 RepID=A0A5P1FG65_ASPOF|nr:uncharacterized protein A4U43_C02F2620 [Asparagus officinalis]